MVTISFEVDGVVNAKCECEWCDCPNQTMIGVCIPCLMKLDDETP